MKLARRVDTIIYYLVIPIGVVTAFVNLLPGGSFVTAMLCAVWTAFVYMSHKQHRGWRDRTNAYSVAEKKDRARFAISVLQLKSQVAFSSWERYKKMAGQDQDVLDGILELYQEVADSWIPGDADEKYHTLKRAAARVVETGRPERVLH